MLSALKSADATRLCVLGCHRKIGRLLRVQGGELMGPKARGPMVSSLMVRRSVGHGCGHR